MGLVVEVYHIFEKKQSFSCTEYSRFALQNSMCRFERGGAWSSRKYRTLTVGATPPHIAKLSSWETK